MPVDSDGYLAATSAPPPPLEAVLLFQQLSNLLQTRKAAPPSGLALASIWHRFSRFRLSAPKSCNSILTILGIHAATRFEQYGHVSIWNLDARVSFKGVQDVLWGDVLGSCLPWDYPRKLRSGLLIHSAPHAREYSAATVHVALNSMKGASSLIPASLVFKKVYGNLARILPGHLLTRAIQKDPLNWVLGRGPAADALDVFFGTMLCVESPVES